MSRQVICGHLARVAPEAPAVASSRASSPPLPDQRNSAAVGAPPGATLPQASHSIPADQPRSGTAAQTRLRVACSLACQLLFLSRTRALHRPLVAVFRKLSPAGQQVVAEVLCEQVRRATCWVAGLLYAGLEATRAYTAAHVTVLPKR